jgi:hypothetical protein
MKSKHIDQAETILDKMRRIAKIEEGLFKALAQQAPQSTILEFRNQIDDILQEKYVNLPAGRSNRRIRTAKASA